MSKPKCDRCGWEDVTHKADDVLKQYFPEYENLCEYDFHILHAYVEIIKKMKEREGRLVEIA